MSKVKEKETENRTPSEGQTIKPAISVDIDPFSHLLDFDPDKEKTKDKGKKNPEKNNQS